MKACLFVVSILLSLHSFGQQPVTFEDSIKLWLPVTYKDSMQLWRYSLDTTYHGTEYDSIKPKGCIKFWRIRPVIDSTSDQSYKRVCNPAMTFNIFDSKDSAYCSRRSLYMILISNCQAPGTGGDLFIKGKYVFFNQSPCVDCLLSDARVDYCRYVINAVFSKVDTTKITTLQSVVQQFPIAKGKPWF